uniref:Uncharacterized protein n=1 Tax=Parascaris equorum TaxID=6256 RepID=A0A914R5V6_PAREQ
MVLGCSSSTWHNLPDTQTHSELEIALDHANKANADAQKTIKRYQEQIRELQLQIEDEQRQKEDLV